MLQSPCPFYHEADYKQVSEAEIKVRILKLVLDECK